MIENESNTNIFTQIESLSAAAARDPHLYADQWHVQHLRERTIQKQDGTHYRDKNMYIETRHYTDEF